jgi:predicted RND superfamily exporter protein
MRPWVSVPLDHPRVAVGLCVALTVLSVPGVLRLPLETDGRSLFAPEHPALRFQREVDDTYASAEFLVIGIESAPGADVFAPAPLNAVLSLTRRIAALPGVRAEEIRSLATELSPAWSDGALHLTHPIAVAMRNAADVADARAATLREPAFRGVLLSRDARDTAIYVPLDEHADRRALYYRIATIVDEEWRTNPGLASYQAHLLGPAAAESLLGDHVLGDLARLLPLGLAVVALVLWAWFRQMSIVFIGLGEGLAVVLWTLGAMALFGRPISLVTVVMPVILSTYCVADTIHVAQHFSAHCRASGIRSRRYAMEATLDEVVTPIALTSLTTATGFLSFAISPIPPLRDFGLFSALGILFAVALSVLVVPAALLITPFGRAGREIAAHPRITRALEALGAAAARAPRRVVALVTLATVALGAGAWRLEIRDSWVQNFSAGSPLVRGDRWFNRAFYGSNVFNVIVTPRGRSVHDPAFLSEMARLQGRLEGMDEVGGTRSLIDPLRTVSRVLEGQSRIPRTARESHEWGLLYRMAGGSHDIGFYLDPEETATNVWVFLNHASYERTAAVLREVERFEWRLPPEQTPIVRAAGDAYLGYRLVDSIASGQVTSALVALGSTFLVIWWMVRSIPKALLVVLPVTLSVVWNFGVMGWFGLPLGVATSTFCAIAFGLGDDFAMHWIARLCLGLERGLAWDRAIRFTSGSTGGAILLQGFVVLFGFSVLLVSSAPPNRYLALVLCLNLATCLGASLIVLPAVATLLRRGFATYAPAASPVALEERSA